MTLIIGCISKDFGIIAGDTQLSSGDLVRGKFERIIKHKVHQYGPNFAMGILGHWSYIDPVGNGKGTMIDYHDTLHKRLSDSKLTDKLGYLTEYLPKRANVEATAIYINRDEDFAIGCVTSDGNTKTIKRIDLDGLTLMFNEPFFETNPNFVESLIREFYMSEKLTDSLHDSIFMLNNIILKIIANGKTLDLSVDGASLLGIPSSVGGYVTVQVLSEGIHHRNCLFKYYSDPNVLLDRTTYPFARSVDRSKNINYVDNLAMLVRGSIYASLKITEGLKAVLLKQIKYLHETKVLETDLLRYLIDEINKQYALEIPQLNEDEDTSELKIEFFSEDEETNDFYKRFF
ncbi:hypothetical protein FGF1_12910 [Flavobacteriaceae bacterium GF1]